MLEIRYLKCRYPYNLITDHFSSLGKHSLFFLLLLFCSGISWKWISYLYVAFCHFLSSISIIFFIIMFVIVFFSLILGKLVFFKISITECFIQYNVLFFFLPWFKNLLLRFTFSLFRLLMLFCPTVPRKSYTA